MTDPARRPVARWPVLVLLAAAILLAGCELATGTVRTATELQNAGIRNPDLNYNDGVATLRFDADPNPLEARAEQDRAAAVIWRNLPFRIDRITVTADGGSFPNRRDYPRALLEQELGPRPADLDRSVADIARRTAVIASVVGLVLLVLIVVVIVLVVRAVRRRPAPQPAGAWPQGGAPQPWNQPPGWGQPPPGQPPPGQPGWGQPPPPSWGQAPPPPPQSWGEAPPQQWGQPTPPPGQPAPAPPAPRPEAPPRGPGDTQRLEPGPPPPPASPPEEQGPTPPS